MLIVSCLLISNLGSSFAQDKAAHGAVQVHVVITAEAQREDSELPALRQDDLKVKQGKTFLQVTQLIPARGEAATLQLFILIDDTLGSGVGNNLTDIRQFISAQPATTSIAIGYMSNATVNIVQNFTPDHALAAKALRLPRGNLSTMDSPYLSLISLVKGWPQQNVRREVLMVTDGIDRLRGEKPSFSLGTSNAVSFKPYLERLQKIFDSQYFLVFLATPGKKPGLQRVKITTELANVEIAAPDNVWVSAGK
jgi:hypothetical protein